MDSNGVHNRSPEEKWPDHKSEKYHKPVFQRAFIGHVIVNYEYAHNDGVNNSEKNI